MKNQKKTTLIVALLAGVLILLITLTALDFRQPGKTTWLPPVADPLTEEIILNAEYSGIYPEAVRLVDGRYEGEPFVAGGASRPTLQVERTAFGDINGDGQLDGAAILIENSGGSGSFYYLAVVLNQEGKPDHAASLLLGDRLQVQSLSVADGKIDLTAKRHAASDPQCCPSEVSDQVFRLEGNQLVAVE